MRMTAAEALAYVKLYGCTADFPALTDEEVGIVIAGCKSADEFGNGIHDAGYVETYRIEMAVKNVWELKASRAAGLHDMQAGDQNLSRSQIGKQCMEKAELWRRKIPLGSTRLAGRYQWPSRFPVGSPVRNDMPPVPPVVITGLDVDTLLQGVEIGHVLTAVEWWISQNAETYENEDQVELEHVVTDIEWWMVTPLVTYDHEDWAELDHSITGIDWWNVSPLDTYEDVNDVDVIHALTEISWWNAPVPGPNLMYNPGFELGINWYSIHDDTTGFTGHISAATVPGEVHSGSIAAKVVSGTTDTANITRLSQDCDTTPGKTYMLSFWAKGDGVNIPHFFIYDRTTSVNITPEPVAISGLTNEWMEVSYTFVAPEGATLIRSVLYGPYVVGGTVWYDDLYFGEVVPSDLGISEISSSVSVEHAISAIGWALYATPVDTWEHVVEAAVAHAVTGVEWEVIPENLMSNEGFENDFDWWTITDSRNGASGTISVASAAGEFHSGAKAAKMLSGNINMATEPRLHQEHELVAGSRYLLTFWCRGDGVNAGRFYMYDRTTDTDITPTVMSTGNATTEWQKVEYPFVVPAGGLNVRLLLYGSEAMYGTVWFDDFSIVLSPLTPLNTSPNDAVAGLSHLPTSIDWVGPVSTYEQVASVGVDGIISGIEWDVVAQPLDTYDEVNSASMTGAITNIDWEVSAPNLWADYNPAFENDFANWVKNDSVNGNHGTVSISTAAGEFYSGTKAAKLVAASTFYDTNPWLHRDTILQPSTNYRLTFWCRGDGTTSGKFYIQDKTTNTAITPTDVSMGNTTTTWQKVTYDFTTPAGASNVRVFLENSGTVNSTLWVDECSLSTR